MFALGILAAVSAATLPSPAEGARAPTLQQKFDEASNLAAARKCAQAIPLFEELERDPRVKPGSMASAAGAVRKGVCQIAIGKENQGELAIAIGLPALLKAGADFAKDISDARRALGDAAYSRSDYLHAAQYFRQALENLTGIERIAVLARLARATAFDGNADALAPAEEALGLLKAVPDMDKNVLASFHTLHARTLLNQGRAQDAYVELKQALKLSGSLTTKTTLAEVSLRSDLAMAAMLVGKKEDAALYLAYTGAGRSEETLSTRPEAMSPPLCGSESGLGPDDVAAVEFSIGDDGVVTSAHTVYSRGGPQVAAAFERAVSEWYWKPDEIAKVPPFYRALTRVELRCSRAMGDRPSLWTAAAQRFHAWAVQQLHLIPARDQEPQKVSAILRKSADDSAAPPLTRIAAIGLLGIHDRTMPAADRIAMLDKALLLSKGNAVPSEVTNWLRAAQIMVADERDARTIRELQKSAVTLAMDPELASDPLVSDTLKMYAVGVSRKRRLPEAQTLAEAVAGDQRLEAKHPLRQLAQLFLANEAARGGDLATAQAHFTRTGLTEEQCALLSLPPAIRATNTGAGSFPALAARMGFGGWVQLEFDITANGRTANVRPIIAYPALIFVEGSKAIGENLRYELTYRPGAATACSANKEMVVFKRD